MRRWVYLGVGMLVAGCGSAQITATPATQTGVAASCAAVSPAEQFAGARLVFVGRMLPGPTTMPGGRGVLGSPARMRVERYLKGHGPRTVRVRTALKIEPGGITGNSEGIDPHAGERWKIYTDSRRQPFDTSVCDGSRRLATHPRAKRGSAALALWHAFPVQANPRPVVPLGEGMVVDPATGFPTAAEKLAYEDGHFALRAALPVWLATLGRFQVVSATAALHRLRASGVHQRDNLPPLVITAVKPGAATFVTDRGRMHLPAWKFFFKGVEDPASVLALAPPDLFIPPPMHRFGPPGAGNAIEDSAVAAPGGTAITLSFIGAHAGNAPCDASYTASAVGSRRAVAFTINEIPAPAGKPGGVCLAIGYHRAAVLHLARPLGARVLVSATDGGAVPVTIRSR